MKATFPPSPQKSFLLTTKTRRFLRSDPSTFAQGHGERSRTMTPWRKRFLWIMTGAEAVYAMVCADVILRARQAYLEGEKAGNPREAYACYESAAVLFTPPESKWSRLARQKMPIVKQKWKRSEERRVGKECRSR